MRNFCGRYRPSRFLCVCGNLFSLANLIICILYVEFSSLVNAAPLIRETNVRFLYYFWDAWKQITEVEANRNVSACLCVRVYALESDYGRADADYDKQTELPGKNKQ